MSAGELVELVRTGRASTRSDLVRVSGLSRTAVTARVNALLDSGLVAEAEEGESTGGRPPGVLAFRPGAGVVLAAAVGRSRTQLAVCDLGARVLASADLEKEVAATPDEVMAEVAERLAGMLEQLGRPAEQVRGAGISIPGTVDLERGMSLDSPIMKGWDGVPLAPYLQEVADVPTFVDNDANALALSERRGHLETFGDAVMLKASTGLGAGLVVGGRLLRGALGAAGEVGHVKVPAAAGRACRCGELGCLEAVAGGWALVQDMQERGLPVGHVRDLVALALDGDAMARRALRESGRRTGEVLGAVVNVLNPEAVVIGGDMARAYDVFVAGVRETLYTHATALAARELQIVPGTHGDSAGLLGCAVMVLDHVLSAAAVDRSLAALPGRRSRVAGSPRT
jgi:predicted NBD/HSP70 family sugar kinase